MKRSDGVIDIPPNPYNLTTVEAEFDRAMRERGARERATACTTAAAQKVWEILLCHTPDVRHWDPEVQGGLAVTIAHRIAVRGELISVETVLHHFELIEED